MRYNKKFMGIFDLFIYIYYTKFLKLYINIKPVRISTEKGTYREKENNIGK